MEIVESAANGFVGGRIIHHYPAPVGIVLFGCGVLGFTPSVVLIELGFAT